MGSVRIIYKDSGKADKIFTGICSAWEDAGTLTVNVSDDELRLIPVTDDMEEIIIRGHI
jgi:hypothetical protein